ncbi:ubiquitin-protein ligase E3A-like [Lingula anatina]|uniref:HECT-type E3 ubiquitin transferase n=1 Tax=Lingula anatina TaxID=7574 RepID=A0A1S3H1T8_LINAN|nr:ubiquitin-protein ligase E3A-like [Lingula anatina]|eukprot:XP_013380090.1 ubiquitin-protein ligase E3A-like [Lingula anatina]
MGGLQKEFFHLICQKVFDPAYGMFAYSEETRSLWFKSSETDNEDEFEMVGIVLGLALYNGVILDVRFPNALYKKLQALPLSLADLMDADPALGHGLMELLNYEGDDIEDVFCQSFQVSVQSYDLTTEVDLVPNGADIPVTQKNKHHFVRRYVDYLLTESIAKQFEAFSRGFHSVCRKESLALFSPDEIELLVCGSTELDFEALEKSAAYDDGYYVSHRTVRAFWEVVHQMTHDQKRQLLHFITGSDRVPLKGLSHLPIVIQRNGGDCDRLPTAMTCFNRLLLPSYATKEKLQSKLMVAIEHGKGFGLT